MKIKNNTLFVVSVISVLILVIAVYAATPNFTDDFEDGLLNLSFFSNTTGTDGGATTEAGGNLLLDGNAPKEVLIGRNASLPATYVLNYTIDFSSEDGGSKSRMIYIFNKSIMTTSLNAPSMNTNNKINVYIQQSSNLLGIMVFNSTDNKMWWNNTSSQWTGTELTGVRVASGYNFIQVERSSTEYVITVKNNSNLSQVYETANMSLSRMRPGNDFWVAGVPGAQEGGQGYLYHYDSRVDNFTVFGTGNTSPLITARSNSGLRFGDNITFTWDYTDGEGDTINRSWTDVFYPNGTKLSTFTAATNNSTAVQVQINNVTVTGSWTINTSITTIGNGSIVTHNNSFNITNVTSFTPLNSSRAMIRDDVWNLPITFNTSRVYDNYVFGFEGDCSNFSRFNETSCTAMSAGNDTTNTTTCSIKTNSTSALVASSCNITINSTIATDSSIWRVPITVSVASTIANLSINQQQNDSFNTTLTTVQSQSKAWIVQNSGGTYNATGCTAKTTSGITATFNDSPFSIIINQTRSIKATFSSATSGNFNGYFYAECTNASDLSGTESTASVATEPTFSIVVTTAGTGGSGSSGGGRSGVPLAIVGDCSLILPSEISLTSVNTARVIDITNNEDTSLNPAFSVAGPIGTVEDAQESITLRDIPASIIGNGGVGKLTVQVDDVLFDDNTTEVWGATLKMSSLECAEQSIPITITRSASLFPGAENFFECFRSFMGGEFFGIPGFAIYGLLSVALALAVFFFRRDVFLAALAGFLGMLLIFLVLIAVGVLPCG